MAFFNSPMMGAMGGGAAPSFGGQGGASAFTSPGINPMTLAMLLRMQGGGIGGAMGGMGAGGPTMGAGGAPQPASTQPTPPQIPGSPQGLGAGAAIPHPTPQAGAMPQGAGSIPQNPLAQLLQSGMLNGQGQGGGIANMLRSLFGGMGNQDFSGGTPGTSGGA